MNRITTFSKLLTAAFVILLATNTWALDPLQNNKHIAVAMSNHALYDDDVTTYGVPTDNYYIYADGGGLNQLHITTDLNNLYGQDTTTNNTSGTFYISTTGGRGYNDDIILLVSIKGTIDPNFGLTITSNGYSWGADSYGHLSGNYPTYAGSYGTGVNGVTFTTADFKYGPSNPYKPGPGTLGTWSLPLFTGQSDFSTNETLLFIDLGRNNTNLTSLTDKGTVKVQYSFSNMNTSASFNAYGWCKSANQPQGINWTQNTKGTGTSSYTVTP
jgi:hypothetical protein